MPGLVNVRQGKSVVRLVLKINLPTTTSFRRCRELSIDMFLVGIYSKVTKLLYIFLLFYVPTKNRHGTTLN